MTTTAEVPDVAPSSPADPLAVSWTRLDGEPETLAGPHSPSGLASLSPGSRVVLSLPFGERLLEGLRVCFSRGLSAVPLDPGFGRSITRWAARASRAAAVWDMDGVSLFGSPPSEPSEALVLWSGLGLDVQTPPWGVVFSLNLLLDRVRAFASAFDLGCGVRVISSLPPWTPAGYLAWLSCSIAHCHYLFCPDGDRVPFHLPTGYAGLVFLSAVDLAGVAASRERLFPHIELACPDPDAASVQSIRDRADSCHVRPFSGPPEAAGFALYDPDCSGRGLTAAEGVAVRFADGQIELAGPGLAQLFLGHGGFGTWDGWLRTGRKATMSAGGGIVLG